MVKFRHRFFPFYYYSSIIPACWYGLSLLITMLPRQMSLCSPTVMLCSNIINLYFNNIIIKKVTADRRRPSVYRKHIFTSVKIVWDKYYVFSCGTGGFSNYSVHRHNIVEPYLPHRNRFSTTAATGSRVHLSLIEFPR